MVHTILDITLSLEELAKPGPKSSPLEFDVVRELQIDDLEPSSSPAPVPRLKKIGERHHALARHLSLGKTHTEAAAILAITPERVQQIVKDPLFTHVLALYKDEVNSQMSSVVENYSGLALDALSELRDRIEQTPESFSPSQLLEIAKVAGDRSGAGPGQTVTNVSLNLSSALNEARERAKKSQEAQEASYKVITK